MAFSKVPCALLYYPIGLLPLDTKIGCKLHLERWWVTASQKRPNKQITPEPQGKNIQLLSRGVSGQNWKGRIEHKGRPKGRSECRLSILKETPWPIWYSVSYEKFLPLVFQYEVEITSWPHNQENMQASTLKWWGKKNNSRRKSHISFWKIPWNFNRHRIFQKIKRRNWKNVLRILIKGYDQSWYICTYMI